ncbi:hypothetical protein [Oceanobacillus bengalensis]|nr:hypothetical protein [Oceanobacillus bengalensis]
MFIKLSHLSALGLNENHVYLIFIIIGVLVCYFIIQPFIEWFVVLQSAKLLSYIVSSLFVILIFFTITIFVPTMSQPFFTILDMLLKVIAIFGVLLGLYGGIRYLIRKT